jgi:hypothetical protein
MTDTLSIVVVDDNPSQASKIIDAAKRGLGDAADSVRFHVVTGPGPSHGANLENEVGKLTDLLKALPELANGQVHKTGPLAALDRAMLVLVDYDLRRLPGAEGWATGERIAQLTRHYTRAGPIISINRRPARTFDLLHRRPPRTNGDLDLNLDDLGCPGLWGRSSNGEYDPWYLPNLIETAKNYKWRVQFVRENYERSLSVSLKIPKPVRPFLPTDFSTVVIDAGRTFSDFAKALLPRKEFDAIPEESRHRSVASLVGSWLQSIVLPPQDVLIDAPHLIRYCPIVLAGSHSIATAKKVAVKSSSARLPIRNERLEQHRFEQHRWLDRPAWWTSGILHEMGIPDINEPWTKEPLGFEFAEDTSTFRRGTTLHGYDSEGFFTTRFVERRREFRDRIEYEPMGRLAT